MKHRDSAPAHEPAGQPNAPRCERAESQGAPEETIESGQISHRDGEGITRKEFLTAATCAAALFAVGGVAAAGPSSGEGAPLRPPGGQDETSLLAACVKCDRCRSVCPRDCIVPATLGDGLLRARSPKMNFRQGYCDFCGGEFLCARVCPLGALKVFDPSRDKIGIAVIDRERCLAYDATPSCGKCVEECPFDAIALSDQGRPVVLGDRCNGCGLCEYICPSSSLRNYAQGGLRGINVQRIERQASQ